YGRINRRIMNTVTFNKTTWLKNFYLNVEHLKEMPQESTGCCSIHIIVAVDTNRFIVLDRPEDSIGRFFKINHFCEVRNIFQIPGKKFLYVRRGVTSIL